VKKSRCVFLDRDGVIKVKPRPGEYILRWEEMEIYPSAVDWIRRHYTVSKPSLREAMCILEAEGLEVAGEATTGDEALELARANPGAVLLLDIAMPGRLDGLATSARLKERGDDVKVIIVSGRDDRDALFSAITAGARGYIAKDADLAVPYGRLPAVYASQGYDTAMLLEANVGFLFRAPDNVRREFPQFKAIEAYADLLGLIRQLME